MAEPVRFEAGPKTVQDILHLYDAKSLNLAPPFQRKSVWNDRDRRKLIDTIVKNYPFPAIFFYRRQEEGRLVYDVIDGKQRIESILRFTNRIRGKRFDAQLQFSDADEPGTYDWTKIERERKQHIITGYKVQVIEVDGELGDVVQIFVRINLTGKALTSAEKRHAHYYRNSHFLRAADKLATSLARDLKRNKIITEGQIVRMKHVELMCDLLLSVHRGTVISKSSALEKVMTSDEMSRRDVSHATRSTASAVRRTLQIFTNIFETRFRNLVDFYSLVFLVSRLQHEAFVLSDKRRNAVARELLAAFSTGVDQLRESRRSWNAAPVELEIYREYLLTVEQGTDKEAQRKKRHNILYGLLASVFERKDDRRLFSVEQRRILWNSTADKVCIECGKTLTWADLTADHVDPHSRGGRTELETLPSSADQITRGRETALAVDAHCFGARLHERLCGVPCQNMIGNAG